MHELLDSIYQIGEEMRRSLSENNLDKFNQLIRYRKETISKLLAMPERKATSPEMSAKITQLEEQFDSIMEVLKSKEQAMLNELHQTQNMKHAQRSYGFDRQPYRFLRNNVTG